MRFGVFGSLSPMSSPTAEATSSPRPTGVLKTFHCCHEPFSEDRSWFSARTASGWRSGRRS